MNITNLWPLIFMILIPAIILLYMLKQKAVEQEISSIMLWREIYKNIEATTPFEKLKKNLLMYLQILAVLLLIFALMAPYLKTGGKSYGSVVVVLDSSASMGSLYDNKTTRLEEAKKQAIDFVDDLSESTQITVVNCSDKSNIIISNSTDKNEIKSRIKSIEQTDVAGDLNRSITMVSSIASQWEKCQTVFFTDTAVDTVNLNASVFDLFTENHNVSLDYINGSYDEEGNLVVIGKVTNHSTEDTSVEVNLYGDDSLLEIQPVEISAAGSEILYFTLSDVSPSILKATLQSDDMLDADNYAYSLLGMQGVKKVLLVTESNAFLEKALQSITNVDLYKSNSYTDSDTGYDLYVFDGYMPEELPAEGSILYINPSEGEEIIVDNRVENRLLTFNEDEIAMYVEGFSFGVNKVSAMKKPGWATSLIDVDSSSALYYGEHEGRCEAVMGFDIHDSDFALQAEFPIFMSNLITYLIDTGMTSSDHYEAGDKVSIHSNINGSDVMIVSPMGERTSIAAGADDSYTNTKTAGVYQISQTVKGEEVKGAFVIDFPTELESMISEPASESTSEGEEVDSTISGGRELRSILLFLLILALLLEWFVFIKQH